MCSWKSQIAIIAQWDTDSANKFTLALNSTEITNKVKCFCDQNQCYADQEGVEMVVRDINQIFHNAAKAAGLQKVNIEPNNILKDKRFDYECKKKRKELRKYSNLKHLQPEDHVLRLSYCEILKQYKQTIKRKSSITSIKNVMI